MIKRVISLLLITLFLLASGVAREMEGTTPSNLYRPTNEVGGPDQTVININNLTIWLRGDGFHDWTVDAAWNGTFPKGTAGAIFSDGILWGSKVNDGGEKLIRVGGNTHSYGNMVGAIQTDEAGDVIGQEDSEADSIRPYRVRPDFQTADLTDDAANYFLIPTDDVTSSNIEEIYEQYEIDWVNWRAGVGAPFDDRDGNGKYEPDPDEDGVYAELEVDANGDTTYIEDIPGIPGAHQTLWTVYNDLDEGVVQAFYGSPSTGVEVQETYWAYALEPPLGNTVFKRVRIIYKGKVDTPSGSDLEDMYIMQWSDPDLGQYSDDYLGCDTTLSLGYVYNASNSDAVWDAWGMKPPAAGYDFFQGPLVYTGEDTDTTAIFDLKKMPPGYINLPMTTFVFFAAGSPRGDPPGDYDGTLQWYNLMRGCEPDPGYPSCDPLIDENGNITQFELTGDPVKGTGDLDGKPTTENLMRFPPGDRRMCISSGPFNMSLGDTQEVVIAMIGAAGETYLQSVDLLKYYDGKVQEAYDNLFDLPSPPPPPKLRIIELDEELVLEWESDEEAVEATESSYIKGYKFEGYNVYQFPTATASKEDAKVLARFDLINDVASIFQDEFSMEYGSTINVPVQKGSNSGITRYLSITEDMFTGRSLINGKAYYFAVTAYSQNQDPNVTTKALESPYSQSLRSARPHAPNPQTIYPNSIGDTLVIENVVGQNDAVVYPKIIDPESEAGQEYEICFTVDAGTKTWDFVLVDVTPEDTLMSDVLVYNPYGANVIGADTVYRFPGDYGGFSLYVKDAPSGIKSVTEGGQNVLGKPNPTGEYYLSGSLKGLEGGAIDEHNYEIRFTSTGSYALAGAPDCYLTQTFWSHVPFEVYDLGETESDTDDVQLFAYFQDAGEDSTWNTEGNDQIDGYSVFDNLAIAKVEYSEEGFDGIDNDNDGKIDGEDTNEPPDKVRIYMPSTFKSVQNILFVDKTDTGNDPSTGTTILFGTYKGIKDGDVKGFTLGTYETEDTGATPKKRVKDITVFPNPYLGLNIWETSSYEKYVTFSHLPRKAIIRIYTLAGVLVRTIEKDDETQFSRWNLTNEFDLPVASGMYIVHIDMPDINKETILKLAIVQEQQYLRSY